MELWKRIWMDCMGGNLLLWVFLIVATITRKANSLLILMHRHTLQLRGIVTLKLQHTFQCWHPTACFPLHMWSRAFKHLDVMMNYMMAFQDVVAPVLLQTNCQVGDLPPKIRLHHLHTSHCRFLFLLSGLGRRK